MVVRLEATWTDASIQRAGIGTIIAQTKTTRTLEMTADQLVGAISLAETDHARSLAATVAARGLDGWRPDTQTGDTASVESTGASAPPQPGHASRPQ